MISRRCLFGWKRRKFIHRVFPLFRFRLMNSSGIGFAVHMCTGTHTHTYEKRETNGTVSVIIIELGQSPLGKQDTQRQTGVWKIMENKIKQKRNITYKSRGQSLESAMQQSKVYLCVWCGRQRALCAPHFQWGSAVCARVRPAKKKSSKLMVKQVKMHHCFVAVCRWSDRARLVSVNATTTPIGV